MSVPVPVLVSGQSYFLGLVKVDQPLLKTANPVNKKITIFIMINGYFLFY